MFVSILIYFVPYFLPLLTSVHATSQQVGRRQAHGPRSMINTSVRSSNGTNITSNFRTKIYVQPQVVALDGLTNRGIYGERPMTTCTASSAEFHHSHCRHREDTSGSLREYLIWCREISPSNTFTESLFPAAATAMVGNLPFRATDHSLFAEIGICNKDEICIESLHAVTWTSEFVLTANCVPVKYFKDQLPEEDLPKDEDKDGGASSSSSGLADKTASVFVSKPDSQTPLQVQGMDLSLYDISESGSSSGLGSDDDAAAGVLQERNCTDCFELRTTKAFPKRDKHDLELEVSLVGAGSAALTGVLWVALMSGR